MTSTAAKVRHVLRAGQTRDHECHWPGCDRQVPPAMWGCRPHWYSLPKNLRDAIWISYKPGQETTMRPSKDYLHAAREAQAWIAEHAKVAATGSMKALSILQPWAWAIVRPDLADPAARLRALAEHKIKPVENRTWPTSFRGRFLIHAGKSYTRSMHEGYTESFASTFGIALPAYTDMQTGGIVGSAELVDCRVGDTSHWAVEGQFQFVLVNARPEPFRPYRGQLQFFDVPNEFTEAPEPQANLL